MATTDQEIAELRLHRSLSPAAFPLAPSAHAALDPSPVADHLWDDSAISSAAARPWGVGDDSSEVLRSYDGLGSSSDAAPSYGVPAAASVVAHPWGFGDDSAHIAWPYGAPGLAPRISHQRGEVPAPRDDGQHPLVPGLPRSFEEFRSAITTQAPALDPGRPGLRLLLLIGALAAIVGGIYAWRSQPEPVPIAAQPSLSTSSSVVGSALHMGSAPGAGATSRTGPRQGAGSLEGSSSPPGSAPLPGSVSPPGSVSSPGSATIPATLTAPGGPEVTVHVTGKVRHSGVYTLSAGSRVTDAVAAAGGVRGKIPTGSINLARRLTDGEQIIVGAPARPASAITTTGDSAGDLATDSTAVLDINAATVDQLEQLPGVGEVLARRIAEFRTTNGGFRAIEQLRDVSGIGPRKYDELKNRVRV